MSNQTKNAKPVDNVNYALGKPKKISVISAGDGEETLTVSFANVFLNSQSKKTAVLNASRSWGKLLKIPPIKSCANDPIKLRFINFVNPRYNNPHAKLLYCIDANKHVHNLDIDTFLLAAAHGIEKDGTFNDYFVWVKTTKGPKLVIYGGSGHESAVVAKRNLDRYAKFEINLVPGDLYLTKTGGAKIYLGDIEVDGQRYQAWKDTHFSLNIDFDVPDVERFLTDWKGVASDAALKNESVKTAFHAIVQRRSYMVSSTVDLVKRTPQSIIKNLGNVFASPRNLFNESLTSQYNVSMSGGKYTHNAFKIAFDKLYNQLNGNQRYRYNSYGQPQITVSKEAFLKELETTHGFKWVK